MEELLKQLLLAQSQAKAQEAAAQDAAFKAQVAQRERMKVYGARITPRTLSQGETTVRMAEGDKPGETVVRMKEVVPTQGDLQGLADRKAWKEAHEKRGMFPETTPGGGREMYNRGMYGLGRPMGGYSYEQPQVVHMREQPGIDLDIGPVEVSPSVDLDVGPATVTPTGNQTRGPGGMVQRRSAHGGMPVFDRADDLNRALQANDIAAAAERGQPVSPHMYQGLQPDEITGALGLGGQMRGYGGEPSLRPSTQASPQYRGLVYRPPEEDPDLTRERLRQEKAGVVDKFTSKHGYVQDLFQDMSAEQAAQLISDQLQARRRALGDEWAFAMGPST